MHRFTSMQPILLPPRSSRASVGRNLAEFGEKLESWKHAHPLSRRIFSLVVDKFGKVVHEYLEPIETWNGVYALSAILAMPSVQDTQRIFPHSLFTTPRAYLDLSRSFFSLRFGIPETIDRSMLRFLNSPPFFLDCGGEGAREA